MAWKFLLLWATTSYKNKISYLHGQVLNSQKAIFLPSKNKFSRKCLYHLLFSMLIFWHLFGPYNATCFGYVQKIKQLNYFYQSKLDGYDKSFRIINHMVDIIIRKQYIKHFHRHSLSYVYKYIYIFTFNNI